jgi:hypothetical protein
MIEVEYGIPIPPRATGRPRNRTYPVWEMDVGGSFLVKAESAALAFARAYSVVSQAKRLGRKFTMRTAPEGVRVWRTA